MIISQRGNRKNELVLLINGNYYLISKNNHFILPMNYYTKELKEIEIHEILFDKPLKEFIYHKISNGIISSFFLKIISFFYMFLLKNEQEFLTLKSMTNDLIEVNDKLKINDVKINIIKKILIKIIKFINKK